MISRLHIITQHLKENSHLDQIKQLKESSVEWIQLRVKSQDQKSWFETGRKAKEILDGSKIKLIINDNVYLAKEIDADGVHLGLNDMGIKEARSILGDDKIIGATSNTYNDVIASYDAGADYIGLGPFQETKTKENLSPVIPFFGYEVIMKKLELNKIKIPVIAIGGIKLNDVSKLLAAGLHGVAVSSAIVRSKKIKEAADAFQEKANNFNFIKRNT